MGREDFLVSPANANAVAMIDRWPDWPSHALCLVGPQGSGKSHLGQVWKAQADAQDLDPAAIGLDPTYGQDQPAYLIEDADQGMDEEALLHLYNVCRDVSGYLLFTARTAPGRWPIRLPDLASRMKAMPVVHLAPPDERLLQAVLMKQFRDRQINAPLAVVLEISRRLERSFEAVACIVDRLDEHAMAARRPLNVRMARTILNQMAQRE